MCVGLCKVIVLTLTSNHTRELFKRGNTYRNSHTILKVINCGLLVCIWYSIPYKEREMEINVVLRLNVTL